MRGEKKCIRKQIKATHMTRELLLDNCKAIQVHSMKTIETGSTMYYWAIGYSRHLHSPSASAEGAGVDAKPKL